MSTIRGQQEFELRVAEVTIQRLTNGHVCIRFEPIVVAPAKIRKQSKHVHLADKFKELVQCPGFLGEVRFQSGDVDREVSGNGKVGSVRKMEMVDWIHFDPTVRNAEIQQQSSGDCLRVSQQSVKVGGRIEGVTLATEGAAVSADHVMLLGEQHAQPFTRQ